jgi:hypothetical protein
LNGIKMTIEITRLSKCAFVIVTESDKLTLSNWKLGMKTPYEDLPTVITLKDDGSTD